MPLSPRAAPEDQFGDFSFAFQPIVDIETGTTYSHEALVRGRNGESAGSVLDGHRARIALFDSICRARALRVASSVGLPGNLNINLLPSVALDEAFGLASTLAAARRERFSPERIIVEATEVDLIGDPAHFAGVLNQYRRAGIRFAIDDFGAGYSGLSLLAEFQPDMVKLDMRLVRNIHSHGPRQSIVRAIRQVCLDLGMDLVAEGVETVEEFRWFAGLGVHLFQGYLFGQPLFEGTPEFVIPDR
ncbi:MAG TPA: EAL domain-containing protein [Pseudoxanthomonas sp.]|nr:EAL domain-containing protein [Pseudoxanthomonas sp.]